MAQPPAASSGPAAGPATAIEAAPRPTGADEKRRRILEAVRTVCGRRGLDGTRMDEIAAEARVSKGTLYNYFDDKESLIVAGILAHYEATTDRVMESMPDGLDPDEALQTISDLLVDLFPRIRSEMLVNFQSWGAVVQHPNARRELFTALSDLYGRCQRAFEELVFAGQQAGVFETSVDARVFTRSWMALYDGFVYRAAFDPDGALPDHLRASLNDFIQSTLMRRPDSAGVEDAP